MRTESKGGGTILTSGIVGTINQDTRMKGNLSFPYRDSHFEQILHETWILIF